MMLLLLSYTLILMPTWGENGQPLVIAGLTTEQAAKDLGNQIRTTIRQPRCHAGAVFGDGGPREMTFKEASIACSAYREPIIVETHP